MTLTAGGPMGRSQDGGDIELIMAKWASQRVWGGGCERGEGRGRRQGVTAWWETQVTVSPTHNLK